MTLPLSTGLRLAALALAVLLVVGANPAFGQSPSDIYAQWCTACHDADGRSREAKLAARRAIDFTDCRFATAESEADWAHVISAGGAAAGGSPAMPPFPMLDAEQVAGLVRVLRGFCTEGGWPSGNLDFPQSVTAIQPFPESEAVLRPAVSHGATTRVRTELEAAYAARLGKTSEIEVGVPAETVAWLGGPVVGMGDIDLRFKHVLTARERQRVIAAAGASISAPTGSQRWSFGEGTSVLEPFLAGAVGWRRWYLGGDVRGLFPLPPPPSEPIRHVAYDVSLLRALGAARSPWTAGFEVNGASTGVALTPEVVYRLTANGAWSAGFGLRIPVRPPPPEASDLFRWSGYLRWDYVEGLRRR